MHPPAVSPRNPGHEVRAVTIPALLLAVFGAMALVMTLAWAVQGALANGGWIDVFWTVGSGAVLAAAALVPIDGGAAPTLRQILVAVLVLAWALRLGGYIARRVAGHPEDARYARMRRDWGAAYSRNILGFCLVQAAAAAVLAVSVLLAAYRPGDGLRATDLGGFAILAAAILGEGAADAQMGRFRADPANRGKVADTGLWAWSRHPNYFFEWFGWLAYPLIAFDPARPWTLAALAAPAAMYLVLTRGSGVPPLEAAMLASRGEAYRAYQARTNAFFPFPPRKGRAP
jgi:steroid 5-alpha reductase family enzyme